MQKNRIGDRPPYRCRLLAEASEAISYPSLIRFRGFLACITINANIRFVTASLINCKIRRLSSKTILQKAVIYLDGRHVTFEHSRNFFLNKNERDERKKNKMKSNTMGRKHKCFLYGLSKVFFFLIVYDQVLVTLYN